jgi:hypothetical protein
MQPDEPSPKIFTYDAALELFPEVRRLTERAVTDAAIVEAQMLALMGETPRRQFEVNTPAWSGWAKRVMALGCEVKGLWLVDFDNGEGYYCWKYPEPEIAYFHDYTSGFAGRTKIR